METHTRNNSTNVRVNNGVARIIPLVLNGLWRIAKPLSRYLTHYLFFKTRNYAINVEEAGWLEKAEKRNLLVNGANVKCWQWGEGPAILLVHGWNGRGIMMSRFIEPLLRSGFSAITFDAPGHGESDGKTSNYFFFTDAVRRILHEYSIAGIISYSLGGAAVLNALEKEKLDLKAALISPPLNIKGLLIDTFIEHGVNPDIFLSIILPFEKKYNYNLQADNPIALLPSIKSSLLIVHDLHDRVVPYRESLAAMRKYANISLITTEKLGHKKMIFDADVIDKAVRHIAPTTKKNSPGIRRKLDKSA